ncbi:DUF6932 family protein [Aminobacter aganoensis]|uniref:DUF6932 family protein n=1 Tax=Aminobacter aganoensis TaxID=83264 RepID=UPI0016188AC0|nr:hypothetical protein [Aminobacter aganoensis]
MPVPSFTIDGVLPPYVGLNGPGGAFEDLSPYEVSAVEVVTTFGTSPNRRDILRKWLDHRAALRAAGLARGFQWLDGSFVETKEPKDLDTVIFTYRPLDAVGNDVIWNALVLANLALLERGQVMQAFRLDALLIDLDSGNPEFMIDVARYYVGLFSHRRGDDLWKGMLKVRLEDVADDAAALAILEAAPAVGAVGP